MQAPFTIVIGRIGVGKSEAVRVAFPDSFDVINSANNQHYFKRQLKTKWAAQGIRPPKKTCLIDTSLVGLSDEYEFLRVGQAKPVALDALGNPTPVNTMQMLDLYLNTVKNKSQLAMKKGEKPPYRGVIIDEIGTFLDRVFLEIAPSNTHNGKHNTRDTFMDTGVYALKLGNLCREITACGVAVVMVGHEREKNEGFAGGLACPSANMGIKLGRLADNVLRRCWTQPFENENGVIAPPRLIWDAQGSDDWELKLRGVPPEELSMINDMSLREIHDFAGFEW